LVGGATFSTYGTSVDKTVGEVLALHMIPHV
jgi:hypothetical protein